MKSTPTIEGSILKTCSLRMVFLTDLGIFLLLGASWISLEYLKTRVGSPSIPTLQHLLFLIGLFDITVICTLVVATIFQAHLFNPLLKTMNEAHEITTRCTFFTGIEVPFLIIQACLIGIFPLAVLTHNLCPLLDPSLDLQSSSFFSLHCDLNFMQIRSIILGIGFGLAGAGLFWTHKQEKKLGAPISVTFYWTKTCVREYCILVAIVVVYLVFRILLPFFYAVLQKKLSQALFLFKVFL